MKAANPDLAQTLARAQRQSWWRDPLRRSVLIVLTAAPRLRGLFTSLGDASTFLSWQIELFGRPRIVAAREDIWKLMQLRMAASAQPWTVIELGVAQGKATDWWLRTASAEYLTAWHGFDRFTGLPRAWRGWAEGTFDNGGVPPEIDDDRLRWYVGDVEATISGLDLAEVRKGRILVLFDLDIYEPTAFAWKHLRPVLQAGDLLYFDEAFDPDERRVLQDLVLPAGEFEHVATTGIALGIEVRTLHDPEIDRPPAG